MAIEITSFVKSSIHLSPSAPTPAHEFHIAFIKSHFYYPHRLDGRRVDSHAIVFTVTRTTLTRKIIIAGDNDSADLQEPDASDVESIRDR